MAVTVKCPTCGRDTDRSCITLTRTPDGIVRWVGSEPHPARVERARG